MYLFSGSTGSGVNRDRSGNRKPPQYYLIGCALRGFGFSVLFMDEPVAGVADYQHVTRVFLASSLVGHVMHMQLSRRLAELALPAPPLENELLELLPMVAL